MAEPALARPHRHRRVPLGELDRVEALRDRVLQVLRRLVLAEADEALVALVAEDGIRDGRLADVPGGGADRLDVRREVGRDEDAARLVVDDPCAGLGEELVVRLRAPRHDDEVAGRDPAVDRDGLDARAAAAGLDVRGLALAEVDDAHDVDARRLEVGRGREATVVRRHHDRALRRLDRPQVDEAARAVGQHHADEVVAGEDERLLDDTGRDDDALRADLDERVAVRDRHEAVLEEPDRDRGREELDAGVERSLPELGRARAARPVGEERAADGRALVHEDHAVAARRGRRRRLEPRLTAADHEDVGVLVDDLDALAARPVGVELAEAGGAAEDLLVERPELPRPDERLVVEAGRGERAAELVGRPASGRGRASP